MQVDNGATLFKQVDYSLSKLVHDIEMGEIGLPDIQRPFVWTSAKVRDLFDSMYKGFPVGYLPALNSGSLFSRRQDFHAYANWFGFDKVSHLTSYLNKNLL